MLEGQKSSDGRSGRRTHPRQRLGGGDANLRILILQSADQRRQSNDRRRPSSVQGGDVHDVFDVTTIEWRDAEEEIAICRHRFHRSDNRSSAFP